MWEYYNLAEFFSQPDSDHLLTFLERLNLDDAVRIIGIADNYYHGGNSSVFVSQVEEFLDEAISKFCDVDAEEYVDIQDCYNAIQRVTKTTLEYEVGDESDANTIFDEAEEFVDAAEAVDILEEEVSDRVIEHLADILFKLPERFPYYAYDYSDCVYVSGAEYLIDSYLNDVSGLIPDDEDDEDKGYSLIDAIFER